MKTRVPLVVDAEVEFMNSVLADPIAQAHPPLVARNGKQAQLILADQQNAIVAIFVNSDIQQTPAISVVRYAHLKRPGVPIYLLVDKPDSGWSSGDLRQLGIQKAISKPITYTELMHLVFPAKSAFDAKVVLHNNPNAAEPVDQELTIEDGQFKPILAENYLSGAVSFFDLYVKLASGRYIKILKSGDSFLQDRVMGYLQKGVTYFYIRKDVQEQYLKYCDQVATQLLKNEKVSTDVKITHTMNHGQEMMHFLQNQGINEHSLSYATGFVDNVTTLSKQMRLEENKILSDFMKDLVSYDHGVSTCLMTALVLKAFRYENENLLQTVGLASMFHDIGMSQLPQAIQDLHEDEIQMKPEQVALYQTHPSLGVKLLSKVFEKNTTVLQIVEQHHMRKGGGGFPQQSSATVQLQMAEVVGFCDEASNLMHKVNQTGNKRLFEKFKSSLPMRFSNSIVSVADQIFKHAGL